MATYQDIKRRYEQRVLNRISIRRIALNRLCDEYFPNWKRLKRALRSLHNQGKIQLRYYAPKRARKMELYVFLNGKAPEGAFEPAGWAEKR